MPIRYLLLRHGYAFVFWYVFGVQAGIPVPADPLLLIMGALVGDGRYNFGVSLLASGSAALLGDLIWFELGRWRGRKVLKVLCRFSLEPDHCVQQAELDFEKRGALTLLIAKFVPGMSLVAMPLAGTIGMRRYRFLLADAGGCFLWASAYLTAGAMFHRQIDKLVLLMGLYGTRAGLVIILLISVYILYRWLRRLRVVHQLRGDRVSGAEALSLIDGPEQALVFDLRSELEVRRSGRKIVGATWIRPSEIRTKTQSFDCRREVILYCT